MKSIAITKLNSILEEGSSSLTEQRHRSDTFAIACHLHATGHQKAGRKLITELFNLLGWHRRKTYFNSLLDTLSGNEKRYAYAVFASGEIKSLFESPHGHPEA